MIIVAGEFQIDPKDVDAAKAAMIDMAAETAKEEGCLHYRFYEDVEHAGNLHVYEEWETDAHLAAHAASAHMAVFRGIMGGLNVLSRNVKKREGGPAIAL